MGCRQTVVNVILAIKFYFPQLSGTFNDIRPSLEGWAKQVPPTPRHGIPTLVAVELAVELLEKSMVYMATAVLTAFEFYLQSGDTK